MQLLGRSPERRSRRRIFNIRQALVFTNINQQKLEIKIKILMGQKRIDMERNYFKTPFIGTGVPKRKSLTSIRMNAWIR